MNNDPTNPAAHNAKRWEIACQQLATFSAPFLVVGDDELEGFIGGRVLVGSSEYHKVITALANDAGLRERWQERLDLLAQYGAEELSRLSTPFDTIGDDALEDFIAGRLSVGHPEYQKVITALANDAGLRERWQERLDWSAQHGAEELSRLSAPFDTIGDDKLEDFVAGRLSAESPEYHVVISALANDAGLRERWQRRMDAQAQSACEDLAALSAPFVAVNNEALDAFAAGQMSPESTEYQAVISALANDAGLREGWQQRDKLAGPEASQTTANTNVVPLSVARGALKVRSSTAAKKVETVRRRTWQPAWAAAAGIVGLGLMLTITLQQPSIDPEADAKRPVDGIGRSHEPVNAPLSFDEINFASVIKKSLSEPLLSPPLDLIRSLDARPVSSVQRPFQLGAGLLAQEMADFASDQEWRALASSLLERALPVECGKSCALHAAIGMWSMSMHAHCIAGSADAVKIPLRTVAQRLQSMRSVDSTWPSLSDGNCNDASRVWREITRGTIETVDGYSPKPGE